MRNPGRSAFLSVSRRLRTFRGGHKKSVLFLKLIVLIIRHRLKPFIGCILTGNLDSQMGEPAVGGSPVPVLDIGWDMDYRTWQYLLCGFSFLLIPTTTGNAYKHLTAAACGTMYMPVVAATRLKGDIRKWYL